MASSIKQLMDELKVVAPHISRLHSLGELERGLWPAIDAVVRFLDDGSSGNVHIKVNKGLIGEVRTQITEYTSQTSNKKDSFDD